ncbi:MAG: helix-turn-helix domain-containing protein [Clostridiales bacterium]|nr:helix-turn-helix domain-containing protein [Clostridiales bacterium]
MNIIRKLRTQHNVSQKELAEICHVHQTAVSQWENDRTVPDRESLTVLSAYFGVSVDTLLGIDKTRSNLVPVLGRVRAGLPVEAVEEVLDYEEISPLMAAGGDYFGLRVTGDSMTPRICEGDTVIVRRQSDVDSGDIAVVLIGGTDATVKKVIKNGTNIMLVPLNSSYEPLVFSPDEIKDIPVNILGKVMELRRKF